MSISDKYDYPYGKLLSFGYTHADNDQVYADVEAAITEKGDTVFVSADIPVIGKRLRPSFTLSEGSTLWVDGEQQVSGQSSQRFTTPIVYTLAQPKHWIYQLREVVEEVPEQDKEEDNNTSSLEGWSLNQVDISQLTTTNAPSNYEGEGLESLWDNMPGTFYHSTWGYGSYLKLTWMNNGYWGDGITEWPYLEVELAESIENFCFSYTTSSQNDRFPQGWYISAYNATTGEWDKVGVLSDTEDNLPQMYLEQYFSPVYSLGEQYSRIRFELTKASYKNYMVLSEFALYS